MRNIVSPLEGIRSPFGPRYGGFSPASLFAAGEQGVWYDPSDLTTMFQDSAGTTPVTAVEQPVGRILDKSGRGNHATQSTTAARPVLSARVNLLTYSEQFDISAAWKPFAAGTGINPVVTANDAVAPNGTTTADKIVFDRGVGNTITDHSYIQQSVTVAVGSTYAASFWIKAATAGDIGKQLAYRSVASGSYTTVTLTASWQRLTLTEVAALASPTVEFASRGTVSSSNSVGVNLWGADLRPANQTTLLPVYQRIAAATDYDTTGFPFYLRFDGTDDSMATGTITPGVDKAQVFAGVRKQSDAALGLAVELSANLNLNVGSFALFAPVLSSSRRDYRFTSRGTISSAAETGDTFIAPITNVLGCFGDISGDIVTLRANGTQVAQSTTDQGTGNYLAYPLYIGRRGGATLPFNGNLYSLIVRFGSNLDATTISNTETWVNSKTLAY